MASNRAISQVWFSIGCAYPGRWPDPTEEVLEWWRAYFAEVSDEALVGAVLAWSGPFPPSAPELREAARSTATGPTRRVLDRSHRPFSPETALEAPESRSQPKNVVTYLHDARRALGGDTA